VMADSVVQRLEAVTSQLERYAAAFPDPERKKVVIPTKPGEGMEEVFSEISKGVDIVKGLRHVTPEKKKEHPEAPAAAPSAPAAAPEVEEEAELVPKRAVAVALPSAAKGPRDPESIYHRKGTWFCKNFDKKTVSIPDVKIKQNVYILDARESTITIPDKAKAIQIDGGYNIAVNVTSVVSLVEVFNSNRVKIYIDQACPGISIDKSHSVEIHLSRGMLALPPNVVTSSSTEVTIVIPGKSDKDPQVWLPLPEQFVSKLSPGGVIVTEPVKS